MYRVGNFPTDGNKQTDAAGSDWWNYPNHTDVVDGYSRAFWRLGDVDVVQRMAQFEVNPNNTLRREIEVTVGKQSYKLQVFRQSIGTSPHCYVVEGSVPRRLERDALHSEFDAYRQHRSVVLRPFPPPAIEVFQRLLGHIACE